MNVDQKLTAIRDIIQQDVGNRGLARDPKDNLITACPDDFANACRSIAEEPEAACMICTGFYIPKGVPPAFETDGPLGVSFLAQTFSRCGIAYFPHCELNVLSSIFSGLELSQTPSAIPPKKPRISHVIYVERAGPALDGRYYTMRGVDISKFMTWNLKRQKSAKTIGIGDGGNEIGMGKIPHETIVKNIPNGDLIHCRVSTDHLIVAGVSNWGAYGLAAGVALLRGQQLPAELFDPDREREILQVMVERGPLVDGVTGQQTATVDGLTWEQYIQPLVEIGKILRA